MPGFNGMGPAGAGPMTGRGRGFCMTYVNQGVGLAPSFARGGGWGRRNWFRATGLPRWARCAPGAFPAGAAPGYPLYNGQALDVLKEQAGYLENALAQVKKRIDELEAEVNKE